MQTILSFSAQSQSLADSIDDAVVFLIPLSAVVGTFLFLTVVGWSRQRRLEREAFYRSQLYQRMLEEGKLSAEELRREDERALAAGRARRRDGLRLAGLLLAAGGLSVAVLLAKFEGLDRAVIGVLPLSLGLVLLWASRAEPQGPGAGGA